MAEMYEIIDQLLSQHGITGAQMSAELGMSRSFMTELRKGRAKSIKLETAQKIAADVPGVTQAASTWQNCAKFPPISSKISASAIWSASAAQRMSRTSSVITDPPTEDMVSHALIHFLTSNCS